MLVLSRIGADVHRPSTSQPLKFCSVTTLLAVFLPTVSVLTSAPQFTLSPMVSKRPSGCAGQWAVAYFLGRSAQLQDVRHLVADLETRQH